MSTHSKTTTAQPDTARAGNLYRLAIVGAANLKGKEVAEVLSDRNFPSLDTKLLDDDESLGKLESRRRRSQLYSKRARRTSSTKWISPSSPAIRIAPAKTGRLVRDAGSAIVDLSYALEDEPGAVVRSPWVERQLGQCADPGSCNPGRR